MKKRNDPRHIARKIALKTLFEYIFHDEDTPLSRFEKIISASKFIPQLDGAVDKNAKNTAPTEKKLKKFDEDLLKDIVTGTYKKIDDIDEMIAACAPEWPLNQIAKVDLSILRMAIFEVLYLERTPTKVAIDEAVELAKEYGGDNSSKFINGVLGTIVKKYAEDDKDTDKNEQNSTKDD